jgi:hypothetical protein
VHAGSDNKCCASSKRCWDVAHENAFEHHKLPIEVFMHRFITALAVLLSFAISSPAKADTVFSLTDATFESGATMTGTININTTTGQFVSADLTYSLGNTSSVFNGPFSDWGETFNGDQFFGDIYDPNGDLFLIDLPVSWIMHYTGGPICSDANLCDDFFGYYESQDGNIDGSKSGLLVPAVVTAEPSSLTLLFTGLTSAFGLGYKRRLGR